MKWYSEEIKEGYLLVSKIISNNIKQKYPGVEYVGIIPESFNNLFNPDIDVHKVPEIDLVICFDFTDSPNSTEYNSKMGIDALNLITLSVGSIFPNAEFLSRHKNIYTSKFCVNCKEYCEGIVPYVY